MASLVKIKKDDDNTLVQNKPDFSGFSEYLVNWSVMMSSGKAEDMMTINFANVPLFDGDVIVKGQEIVIPIQNTDAKIKLYVRSISFKLTRASTPNFTLVLKTRKIMFDQYIPEGAVVGKAGDPAYKVIKKIINKLGLAGDITIASDVDKTIKWPSGVEVALSGQQNVLKFIDKAANKYFRWWISIYGELNIQLIYSQSTRQTRIDFDKIKPVFESMGFMTQHRWDKQEKNITVDRALKNPAKQPKLYVIQQSAEPGVAATATVKKVPANQKVTEKSLQNISVLDQTFSLTLAGTFWVDANSRVFLNGFPVGDGQYMVGSCTISNSSNNAVTSIQLLTTGDATPHKKVTPTDTSDKDKSGRDTKYVIKQGSKPGTSSYSKGKNSE